MRKPPCLVLSAMVALACLTAAVASARPGTQETGATGSDPIVAGSFTSPRTDAEAAHPGRSGALTPEEYRLAAAAWRYFQNNTQATTGLVNSVDAYPSTTMWDVGSAVGAIVSANGLGLIDADEATARLGKMLDTLGSIPLFRGICPNKAYNSITATRVTYSNQPGEIGCSALDVARALYWMRIVQQRYPALSGKVGAAVAHWRPETLVRDGQLFGTVPQGETGVQFLQEGRLGYEEYGAKAFRLWGFDTHEAAKPQPYGLISLYGVRIPYDSRDPRVTNAHNYVVTESYVLDGIEYGWDEPDDVTSGPFEHTSGWIARAANRVYLAQQRRFEQTGILTARTEHQLAAAPYFVYDTVFSDGRPWATITDSGELHPESAAVALKGAIGLWVLWKTPYTDRLFAAVREAFDPQKGIYEGLLENGKGKISTFTANNNGIILESLLYKVQGKILRPDPAPVHAPKITANAGFTRPRAEAQDSPPVVPQLTNESTAPLDAASSRTSIASAPITPAPGADPPPAVQARSLSNDERAMATVAWQYFKNNTQAATGLVNAVDGYPSATLWDVAAGFGAVVAAERLGLIDRVEAISRLNRPLDTLSSVRLFRGLCPNKVYDTRSAETTNYSNQPGEIGCSALDVGRLLVWMKIVEERYPELRQKVALTVRHWNITNLVRGGELYGATADRRGAPQFLQEGRLGYEEYSARGYQLWGLDTRKALAPDPFDTLRIEGVPIMHDRRSEANGGGLNAVVTESFVLYGVELGFPEVGPGGDPNSGWIKAQADNVVLAQKRRYERTGILTARTEHQLAQAPNFVYDSVFSEGASFVTHDARGKPVPWAAAVATKAALGIWALWPDGYGDLLFRNIRHAFDAQRGFYEGVFEKGGLVRAFTANTNGIILEILLYRLEGPIVGGPRTPAM